jgi:hypothetical protein
MPRRIGWLGISATKETGPLPFLCSSFSRNPHFYPSLVDQEDMKALQQRNRFAAEESAHIQPIRKDD